MGESTRSPADAPRHAPRPAGFAPYTRQETSDERPNRRTRPRDQAQEDLGTDTGHRIVQPPLRVELFLVAHDDVTGRPHIDPDRLSPSLTAAILLELWLARRVQIGWRYDARHGTYQADPGLITVRDTAPTGDPLQDAALAMLWRASGTRTHDFIRDFSAQDLYERVRGGMIAAATLRRTTPPHPHQLPAPPSIPAVYR